MINPVQSGVAFPCHPPDDRFVTEWKTKAARIRISSTREISTFPFLFSCIVIEDHFHSSTSPPTNTGRRLFDLPVREIFSLISRRNQFPVQFIAFPYINFKKHFRMASTAHKTEEEYREYFDPPELLDQKCTQLAKWIAESVHGIVFTGAGISTSTGISDFRSGMNTVLETGGGVWTSLVLLSNLPDHGQYFYYPALSNHSILTVLFHFLYRTS